MHPELTPKDRLIVALDLSSLNEALTLASHLGESVSTLKVGKQLFTAEGPAAVIAMANTRRVFLDLKFHDIPNTVAAAVRQSAALRVSMLTVHAGGGSKMLRAAAEAARESETSPLILAVTVLTSLGDADLHELGITGSAMDQVLRLAELAQKAGCGGVVASAREAAAIRERLGPELAIVTPGVRPVGAETGDQARVVTPGDAIRAGADYLVVGRPITGAVDPAAAADRIAREISAAL